MASETPAAWAISLVVVPPKPRCEKRPTAIRRIWSFLSSADMREAFAAPPSFLLVVISLFSTGVTTWQFQSKYLLTTGSHPLSSTYLLMATARVALEPGQGGSRILRSVVVLFPTPSKYDLYPFATRLLAGLGVKAQQIGGEGHAKLAIVC